MYDLIHLIYVYKERMCEKTKTGIVEIQIYATIELHREALYQGNANNVVDTQQERIQIRGIFVQVFQVKSLNDSSAWTNHPYLGLHVD